MTLPKTNDRIIRRNRERRKETMMTYRTIDNDLNAINGNAAPSRSVRRARRRRSFAALSIRTGGNYGYMPMHGSVDTYEEIL